MATTSQKMIEIKFFVRIRGALTPAPRIDEPVIKIPLDACELLTVLPKTVPSHWILRPYHAAPTTERPMQSAIPVHAHAYGEIDSRKFPTCA
jgi:hypothetical protein